MLEQPLSRHDPGSQVAVANYVATLSSDLSAMARRSGLQSLGYLLEMVSMEAQSLARFVPRRANGGP